MRAARELVALTLREPIATRDDELPRLYTIAAHHGLDDVATRTFTRMLTARIDFARCCSIPGLDLARLFSERQLRFSHFTRMLRSTADDSPFEGMNLRNKKCSSYLSCRQSCGAEHYSVWLFFQVTIMAAYAEEPSLEAVLEHTQVSDALNALLASRCYVATCRSPVFEWRKLRRHLERCEALLPGVAAPEDAVFPAN